MLLTHRWLFVVAAAAFSMTRFAQAVDLPVGTTITLTGTTDAARPELTSTDVINQTLPFSFTNTATGGLVSGTLFDDVSRENVSGTLDFYYQVTMNARSSSTGAIRTSGFTDYSTDVDFRTDSTGTIDPDSAQRFSGAESGSLNFIFNNTPITGGSESQFVFIKTTATTYNDNGLTDITADAGLGDTGLSSELATYAPGSVPEPSMLLIPVTAAVMLGLGRRSRLVHQATAIC
jgi:hypothetical protein